MLRVDGLCKSFGGVEATRDVSLTFPTGSLCSVIGPNGAGKTTFFNLISGALRPDAGRVLLDEVDIVGKSRNEIVRLGIGRAFQVAKLFRTLTVEESLMGALLSLQGKSNNLFGRFPLEETKERAVEVMSQLGLLPKAKVVCGTLSHGDQKLLDMALALVLAPKVLLLDEPVAGMGPDERQQMIATVHALWKRGDLTIVLIEHDMEIVFEISQKIHVLCYGRVLASGTPDEIRGNQSVIEAYLGKSHKEMA